MEFDIFTGRINPRGLKKSGAGDDDWPPDIETSIMTKHDTRAEQIHRLRIANKTRVILTDSERGDFALWMALFMPRVPQGMASIETMIEQAKESRELPVDIMYERRADVIQLMRRRNEKLYSEMVEEFGKNDTDEFLLAILAERIRDSTEKFLPDPKEAYHSHLRTTDLPEFAKILCEYNWVWLYSPHGFVIGDNPLARWSTKHQRWNYGIRKNIEITLPLGKNLCLRLDRRKWQHNNRLQYCPRELTHVYNMRQRLAAIKAVYGPSQKPLEALLRPISRRIWAPKPPP
jgi:hypothetical protein